MMQADMLGGTRGTRGTEFDIAGFQAGHIGGTAGTRAAHGSNPKARNLQNSLCASRKDQAGEAYTVFWFLRHRPGYRGGEGAGFKSETGAERREPRRRVLRQNNIVTYALAPEEEPWAAEA